jgi:hypothetical protein
MRSARGRSYRPGRVLLPGIAALTVLGLGGSAPALTAQVNSLVFDGVTVVDVERGTLVPGQRVVIAGTRIQSIGNAGTVSIPKGAHVVAARGKYLIPGLWDMHVHANHAVDLFYPLLLANGVTGMRDPGSEVPLDTLLQWRREVVAGSRAGPPRQILSGQYISEEGHNGVSVPCRRSEQKTQETCVSSDPADARHLVDSLKAAGADMIKAYNVSAEIYFALAAEARRSAIPFGGHLYPWVTMAQASDSGARIIDHRGNGNRSGELDSLCLPETGSVAGCRPMAERFRRNGTWWILTMIGLDQGGRASEPVAASVHEFSSRFWESDTVLSGTWTRRSTAESSDGVLRVLPLVDFPLLAGTDVGAGDIRALLPGLSLHGELAMYVAEGLTPLQALQTATLNPAKLLHSTDSMGTVAQGKVADLVLLDADPLADITNTTAIRAVVADGRYFDRTALDGLLAEVKAKAKKQP